MSNIITMSSPWLYIWLLRQQEYRTSKVLSTVYDVCKQFLQMTIKNVILKVIVDNKL